MHKPYGQVAVIAFHWVNDDIGVVTLGTELLKIFSKTYNFHVESYKIPTAMSQMALDNKLNNWFLRRALMPSEFTCTRGM
jgi:hypothetical protein